MSLYRTWGGEIYFTFEISNQVEGRVGFGIAYEFDWEQHGGYYFTTRSISIELLKSVIVFEVGFRREQPTPKRDSLI